MKKSFEVPAPLTLEPMLILFVIILLLGMGGCEPKMSEGVTSTTTPSIKRTEAWNELDVPNNWYIFTDTQTKAQYLVIRDGHGLVITDLHREPK